MNLGCEHYKRKVMLVAPCCNKIYVCRFCHDSKEDHELDRNHVQKVVCMICKTQQRVRISCSNCGNRFGQYFCLQCRLYDDEDKKQFHCQECGICRIGGRDSFSHCSRCNMCFNILIIDSHKCITNCGTNDCGLCLEKLHTSRLVLKVPQCGHLIHENCYEKLMTNNLDKCPLCREKFSFVM